MFQDFWKMLWKLKNWEAPICYVQLLRHTWKHSENFGQEIHREHFEGKRESENTVCRTTVMRNWVTCCLPMQDCAKRPTKASRFHFWNTYRAKRSTSHAKMTFFSVVLSKSRTVHTRCTLGEMMIFHGAHTVHKGITIIKEL